MVPYYDKLFEVVSKVKQESYLPGQNYERVYENTIHNLQVVD
jgi:hypothetical protein